MQEWNSTRKANEIYSLYSLNYLSKLNGIRIIYKWKIK